MRYVNLKNPQREYIRALKEGIEKIAIEGTKVVLYKSNRQEPFFIECFNEDSAKVCYEQFIKMKKND